MFCRLISERLFQGENHVGRMIVLWDRQEKNKKKRNKTKWCMFNATIGILVGYNKTVEDNYCFVEVTQPWLTKWFIRWQFKKKKRIVFTFSYTVRTPEAIPFEGQNFTINEFKMLWRLATISYVKQSTHQSSKFTNHKWLSFTLQSFSKNIIVTSDTS